MGTVLENYEDLSEYLVNKGIKKPLLVAGKSFESLRISGFIKELENQKLITVVRFSSFTPNPKYEEVLEGIKVFRENGCDGILAIGGGSAMDVSKCIGLYAGEDSDGADGSFLSKSDARCTVPLIAVPTTAGTGSEVTRFAVIYYKGVKQSVANESIIPDAVLIDETVLSNLPPYQKKATMLDAFCHAIESAWSVKSNEESRSHSEKAIKGLMANYRKYLSQSPLGDDTSRNMLIAAMEAGRAINITQTTAGHAMCYKLTTKYGYAHGHSAALCVRVLWSWMLETLSESDITFSSDAENADNLRMKFEFLAKAFGCKEPEDALRAYEDMLKELDLQTPVIGKEDMDELVKSVNPERLKNNPIVLNAEDIRMLYSKL